MESTVRTSWGREAGVGEETGDGRRDGRRRVEAEDEEERTRKTTRPWCRASAGPPSPSLPTAGGNCEAKKEG